MLNSKLIVYLGRDRIWVKDQVFKWDGKSLDGYLDKISQKFKNKNLKVIAGEAKSFVLSKNVPISLKENEIFSEALKTIPENLSSNNLRWQIVSTNEKKHIQTVEFVAVAESLVTDFKLSIAPISKLIAHTFKNEKTPTLAIWHGYENVAVITFQGIVYLTSTMVGSRQGELNSLLKQAKEEFSLDVKNIITNWPEIQKLVKLPKSFKLEIKNFDPLIEVDQNYSLEISKISEREEKIEENKSSGTKKPLLLLLLVIVLLGVGMFGYYWRSQKPEPVQVSEEKVEEEAVVTEAPEVEENIVEQEPVDYTDFTVEVQNGSGIAGAGAEFAEQLGELGFVGIETSNADNFDYQGLTLRYKSDIPKNLVEEIKIAFSDYEIKEEDTLELSQEYDIILVVGAI